MTEQAAESAQVRAVAAVLADHVLRVVVQRDVPIGRCGCRRWRESSLTVEAVEAAHRNHVAPLVVTALMVLRPGFDSPEEGS